MKFINTISLAAVASGSVVQEKRQTTEVTINNFAADCTPHSSQCSFDIAPPGVTTPIHCSGTATSDGSLPVTSGTCDGDSAYTWFTARTALSSNLFLDIQWLSPYTNDIEIFCHPITPDQINTQNDGASTSQHYVGPSSFTAAVNGC
ncbi:hypothetical protein E8E14_004436 [Neopestalotiopsis sp. 37M]|nr:hypothetical protein E8E14_004436 [Neopestalotiopsis sp. 37M]